MLRGDDVRFDGRLVHGRHHVAALDDDLAGTEGSIGIAQLHEIVVGPVGPALEDRWGIAGEGRAGVHDRGERLVLDINRRRAVGGEGFGLGHHHCDRLAGEDHALGREQHQLRHRPTGKLGAGNHREHTGTPARHRRIHARDARGRVRAQHQPRMGETKEGQVSGVDRLALNLGAPIEPALAGADQAQRARSATTWPRP